MQAIFEGDPSAADAFRVTVSEARFAPYLAQSNGHQDHAISLYHWNARLSQALYLPLQMWEVALRNRLNSFLKSKYNRNWPRDECALRGFRRNERDRLDDTINRLGGRGRTVTLSTDAIVADLNAGFWVALLGSAYDVGFSWRYNLSKIFPHDEKLTSDVAHKISAELLVLRNRVAHHEPIHHLDLPSHKRGVDRLTAGMCSSASLYVAQACTFEAVWNTKPQLTATNENLTTPGKPRAVANAPDLS